MGKASQRKLARQNPLERAPLLFRNVTYQTGLDWPSELPILLRFSHAGTSLFPSRWSVADARIIACGLLKYCELAERKEREEKAAKAALGP